VRFKYPKLIPETTMNDAENAVAGGVTLEWMLAGVYFEQMSQLAVALAIQAGEEPKRPLSEAQLARAVEIHAIESDLLLQLVERQVERVSQQNNKAAFETPDA
jgi:hypothetical protein